MVKKIFLFFYQLQKHTTHVTLNPRFSGVDFSYHTEQKLLSAVFCPSNLSYSYFMYWDFGGIMKYNEFIDKLIQELTPLFPNDTSIVFEQIEKNNGILWDAILIRERNQNYSPTIYTRPYYRQYSDGTAISELVTDIYQIYQQSRVKPPIDFGSILCADEIRKHLSIQLVNGEKNAARLKNCPHIRYLDLAILFFCRIPINGQTDGTFPVRYEHLKLWDLSEDELKELAFRNMIENYPIELLPIQDLLKQIMETDPELPDLFPPNFFDRDTLFYVLSNTSRRYGASAILYPGVLEQFARQINRSFYLIPSSIHEMLLLPDNDSYSADDLSQMLSDVNSTQLPETEILSYNIYHYSMKDKAISQITDH